MTTVSAADMERHWSSLAVPDDDRLPSERVRAWAGGVVRAVVDRDGRRRLLVQLPGGASTANPPRPVAGLTIDVRALAPVGGNRGTWIDIAPTGPLDDQFTALCASIVTDLPADGPADAAGVRDTVERWRKFWSSQSGRLSEEVQAGLFGELWHLLRVLPSVDERTVSAWQGPLGGRHDYVTPDRSVEVKTTTTSTGPVLHRISGVEQLADPEQGELILLSLRAPYDALGQESLQGLLDEARRLADKSGPTCRNLLEDRLVAAGTPLNHPHRYDQSRRVLWQRFYSVVGDFPRITTASFPGGLADGLSNVTYTIDTAACTQWEIE